MTLGDIAKIGTFILDIHKNLLGKDEKLVDAVVAIQRAISETRKQIQSNGYQPNAEIRDHWFEAYKLCQKARKYNRMLYDKARFWDNPQKWLKEPGSLELIPSLRQLEDDCEALLVTIR